MNEIIKIENLSKSFGDIKAVNGISFEVRRGELFAFLGANGAGKSTTINILCGQLEKDGGKIAIDGVDFDGNNAEIKREIGVVFQGSVLDSHLSVLDNLKSRGALYGIVGEELKARIRELSVMLELDEILSRPLNKLSGGQRRRADIARALLHKPKILVLDEPTTGLDPKTRSNIWQVIDELRARENMTVFLTTHYMEEAAEADFVVILDRGEIAARGTPIELKNEYSGDFLTVYGQSEEKFSALGLKYEAPRSGVIRISLQSTKDAVGLITEHPELFCDFEITKGKMDDVFLAVTGKSLTGGDAK